MELQDEEFTFLVEVLRACLELFELNNLHIKRKWANPIFKNGFILPSNGGSSCCKICSMPVICSK